MVRGTSGCNCQACLAQHRVAGLPWLRLTGSCTVQPHWLTVVGAHKCASLLGLWVELHPALGNVQVDGGELVHQGHQLPHQGRAHSAQHLRPIEQLGGEGVGCQLQRKAESGAAEVQTSQGAASHRCREA